MSRYMKLLIAKVVGIILVAPTASWANCEKTEIERILQRNGYTHSHLNTAANGRNSFLINKDGGKFVVHVEEDGDASFRRYFRNDDGYTMDNLAVVMNSLKYIQVYIDSDNDIVMAYDVAVWGNPRCNVDLSENLRLFMNITEEGEKILSEG